ncbi:MAG TPA: sugar transferase [Rhodopila sp.]|uniref:sugar transferase n=1 Tax=Rhodopila sp. TaxID=2480087 RepID=UPI002B9B9630|nr:sugar transferase [Rhodopila sp.]HVY17896.1 sugar transferase [Rhodopila sp.]
MFDSRIRNFEPLAYSDGSVSYAFPPLSTYVVPTSVVLKRIEDVVIALLLLAILGAPMLVAALAIGLTSRGPVLFRQDRIGLHGRPFRMLKFRTMRHAAREHDGCRQATRNDPRVTRLGAVLRRTSFDELPQLLNVLAGTMSIVGPRPHAPGTCAAGRPFETITHRYAARHCVKPGMTGLAQVRGWRGETDTEEKLLRRVDSDLEYIATWSLTGDLKIVCRTVAAVLCMRNAW